MKSIQYILRFALLAFILTWLVPLVALSQGTINENMNTTDQRPDLWVLTLNAHRVGDYAPKVNRLAVIRALDKHGANIRPQDSVIIFHTGVTHTQDGDFLSSFIHPLSKPISLHQIRITSNLLDNSTRASLLYPYLARPLSLYALIRDNFDFSPYRFINVILISEKDCNPNKYDDLSALRRSNPANYEESVKMLNFIESVNGTIEAPGDGMFFPLPLSNGASTSFSRYETFEDKYPDTQSSNDLVSISKFQKGTIVLTLKDTCIFFQRVNRVVVNGIRVMGPTTVSGQTIDISNKNIKYNHHGNDTVELAGNIVRYYTNSILGKRSQLQELTTTIVEGQESIPTGNNNAIADIPTIILFVVILFAFVFLVAAFISTYRNKTIVRIIIRDKDYRISRKALHKMSKETYHLIQIVNNLIITYLDKGICVKDTTDESASPSNIYLITSVNANVIQGKYKLFRGWRDVKRQKEMYAELCQRTRQSRLKFWNKHVYVFDWTDYSNPIEFQISSPTFILEHKKADTISDKEPFLLSNKKQLSAYCTNQRNKIISTRNNVLITKLQYNYKDYWCLNIYDLNYQNKPDAIYLRYVLVVDDAPGIEMDLINTAKWVLKSEGLSVGHLANSPIPESNGIHNVTTPPLTCYLFLRSDKRSQLIYSPFQHDQRRFIDIDEPEEPFELLHFALFDKHLHKHLMTDQKYYSGKIGQTTLQVGKPGSNAIEEFRNERYTNLNFAYGDIRCGEPRTCDISTIEAIIN